MGKMVRYVLGLVKAVVTGVRIEGDRVVVSVRPWASEARRCPVCGGRCRVYDAPRSPRLWRAMDLARSACYLEYAPSRVRCPEHGVLTERVPWARPRSRFTRDFEDWVACLAVRCCASAVAELARVEWHTVGAICSRVFADLEASRGAGRYDGLRRIGVDETSYKKGHRYITVVVDHDSGRLVWAGEGTGKEVLRGFLRGLSRGQRRSIEVVTADGARWIRAVVRRWCPNARWVMDPFHVVAWANDALEEVRRGEWREAKRVADAARPRRSRPGRPAKGDETPREYLEARAEADAVRGTRWALLKDPADLTEAQRAKLESLKRRAGSRLLRAWELKEDLRAVFRAGSACEAAGLLDSWLSRASRCRIEQMVKVEKKVRRRRDDVLAAVELGLGNGRVESVNNKIKVTVRMGYGFRNVDNLISLLMLRCSDVRPEIPGRTRREKKITGRARAEGVAA